MEHHESRSRAADQGDAAVSFGTQRNQLLAAAVLAAILVVPYTYSILRQMTPDQPVAELAASLASNVGLESLISWGLIALGLRLRPLLGQRLTLLEGWPPRNDDARRRTRNTMLLAAGLGVGLGVIIGLAEHLAEPILPKPRNPIATPVAWTGLLASVGAGIQEEIWLRLGIMTALVWMLARVVRRIPPAWGVVWTSNILAALLFGAIHIPQAAMIYQLTGPLIALALLGNGVPGVVFGFLYWKRGLVAAMVCHFAADLVLKAVMPLLGLA